MQKHPFLVKAISNWRKCAFSVGIQDSMRINGANHLQALQGKNSTKDLYTHVYIGAQAISQTYANVEEALKIIEKKTGKNPVEIFVKALENAAPREEIVTIEYGGARYPKAVDCAPHRRIDIALKFFSQGTYAKCFNKKISFPEALADEILAAFKLDQNKSVAIKKKLELERQSDASR